VTAVLLDTHTVLWSFLRSKELSDTVRDILNDTSVSVFVSPVSAYELALKANLGKLSLLPKSFEDLAAQADFAMLPVTAAHFERAGKLPLHNRDPWDRILSAQAILEDMMLVTCDNKMAGLGAKIIW
jgi:PIN domain nuclease of toxin-antitoxin system